MANQLDVSDLIALLRSSTTSSGLAGDTTELKNHLAQTRGDNKLVLIAATPRSSSTFLTNRLVRISGLPPANLCYSYLQNEHDLYPPNLLIYNATGAVSQAHMKATLPNINLIELFAIKPVVLTRDIFDSIASLYDQLHNKDYVTSRNTYSFAWFDKEFLKLDDSDRLNFIIDIMVPWYINFYVTWSSFTAANMVDPLWITYEELHSDTYACVSRIIRFLGIDAEEQRIRENLYVPPQKRVNYNKGVSGRGNELLSAKQKDRILRMASYYPHVDFSRFGLAI